MEIVHCSYQQQTAHLLHQFNKLLCNMYTYDVGEVRKTNVEGPFDCWSADQNCIFVTAEGKSVAKVQKGLLINVAMRPCAGVADARLSARQKILVIVVVIKSWVEKHF